MRAILQSSINSTTTGSDVVIFRLIRDSKFVPRLVIALSKNFISFISFSTIFFSYPLEIDELAEGIFYRFGFNIVDGAYCTDVLRESTMHDAQGGNVKAVGST